MGGVNSPSIVEMQSSCNDIQAFFIPSKFYSAPGEEVTFTNQSSGYHHCSWYMNNVLVSTSVHWSYTFSADGHYDVRLEVKDENETCTMVYVTVNYLQNTNDPAVFNPIAPLCQNINFSLPTTSTNGISGSWSPTFSSANLGSTLYTFTPNSPCSPTTTMSITIIPCGDCDNTSGTQLSGIIGDDLAPNQEYRIVGDIEIQGTVNFQSCVIAIDPNVSITVPENQNLIISESHLYGCYRMWNGIDVRPNGSLKIQASLIEDAKTAVNMFALDNAVSGWRLKVEESIFNKNQVGIKINGYPFNNSNEVFDISTVAFTCREISPDPNFWPTLSDFITPNPAANAYNFEDPLIDPSVYPPLEPLYILIQNGLDLGFVIPYGIWLNNVGNTLNPNATAVFNSFHVGSDEDNLPWVFDKMARGIYALKSNVQVSRPTIFQSHQELAKVSYGIYAESFIQTTGTQILYNPFDGIIQVGASQDAVQFYNVSCAVYVDDYTHLDVQKCRIRSKRTNAGYLSHLGLNGVRYKTPKAAQFVVKDNQFHNIKDGVFALIGHPIIGTKINLNISDNTFSRILPNATGVISSTAIQVSSVSPSSVFYPNPFRIENNSITGSRRGIYLANLDVAGIHIERNAITLEEYIGTAWDAKARFFGINLRTVSSSNSQIYENDIEGFNTVNTQARGIWMDNSTQINVLCNNTKYIGAGLYFYGNCQSRVLQNNMLMNRYGLWLDGQGYIGQQGNANSAAGNTWSGSGATAWTPYQAYQQPPTTAYRIKTYVSQGSYADLSKMFVLPIPASNPDNSWASENDLLIPFSTLSSYQSIFTTPVLGNSDLCDVGPPVGDDPAGVDAPNGIADFDKFLLALEKDAEISSSNTDEPSEVIREQLTYDYLYKNPDIRDSSVVLDSFYVTREFENVGILREMNQKLDEKLLDDAEALRNQVIPNNLVELAYREVLDLQLKYERGLFSEEDSTELHMWAESCFYVYGKAVPIAQTLYNLIYSTTIFFSEDCPEFLPRSVSLNTTSEKSLDVLLYPNPNSNILYAKTNEENVHDANCVIRTIDGKLIYSGSFHFKRGLNLSNLGLDSGVYTVELSFEERDEYIIKKLVFTK